MSKRSAPGPSAHCHELVASTAKGLAGEVYEALMRDDRLFAQWKADNPGRSGDALAEVFVARFWGGYLTAARATLAAMLTGPLDEPSKEAIYHALIADNTLGRQRVQKVHHHQ